MAVSYLKICTYSSLGVSMYMIFEKLLQATGYTMQTTVAQIVGAVVNMILDPIMISVGAVARSSVLTVLLSQRL